ncbi:helix-turn-helix transcriptional regulator [Pseudothauera nasutitermitis]|uniref:Helix-turn-helix transcriptional regulator n=1 Tax=Pseudothauera nasutitermitis TaxID=2565930 RepID=A0A4S4AZX0_9RHOO|nr:helix-turn-helix transcriptional regulator [Pseudothauera nasutitermitis]THF65616.1 helix-turn-helix transcriptional regulator [Pseudothauera nasutitermitis]
MREQISSRLREERRRLGFSSQADFAAEIGASSSSVHNYEAGKRSPDAEYLAKVAEIGGDVLYILTGQRSVGELAPDEAALLDNYRHSPPEKQSALREVGASFAQRDEAVKKARQSHR